MLRNKVFKVSKGYTLIFTLIIFNCCFLLFLSLYTLVTLEYKNIKNSEQEFYNENISENDKTYLINMMSQGLNNGSIVVNISETKESIMNQIKSNSNALRFTHGRSVIYYDVIKDEFILETKLNVFDSQYEIYKYEIRENILNLIYEKTAYIL